MGKRDKKNNEDQTHEFTKKKKPYSRKQKNKKTKKKKKKNQSNIHAIKICSLGTQRCGFIIKHISCIYSMLLIHLLGVLDIF